MSAEGEALLEIGCPRLWGLSCRERSPLLGVRLLGSSRLGVLGNWLSLVGGLSGREQTLGVRIYRGSLAGSKRLGVR